MPKINLHWLSYYAGCILGGIIIGYILARFIPFGRLPEAPIAATPKPDSTFRESPERAESPASRPSTLLFVGDVMLGRSVNKNIQLNKDPSWPFIYVQDILRSADIAYINLESPLTYSCPVTDTGMKFCGDISNVAGLMSAGIDVASVANNHANNYGIDGLNSTVFILKSNGIAATGVAGPAQIIRGPNFYSYYSYNDVGEDAFAYLDRFQKRDNELIIVTFHWGSEYRATPNDRQIKLAHAAIDVGADLVIGAHPHWVQTKEIYKDKPIYYSLGNFVFDQEWSPETKRGLAVKFTYQDLKLIKTEELPVFIDNYGQAHWQ